MCFVMYSFVHSVMWAMEMFCVDLISVILEKHIDYMY